MSEPKVLGRIDSTRFYARPKPYRDEVHAWLRANGIDPRNVALTNDVLVVVMDVPAIAYDRARRDADGHVVWDRLNDEWTDPVHVLLRVPLPAHLDDGIDR